METTHVFWKRCKCQPRVLNVKKTRCSLAPSMRSEALCEQITSGDVSGCVAFWFVKSPIPQQQRRLLWKTPKTASCNKDYFDHLSVAQVIKVRVFSFFIFNYTVFSFCTHIFLFTRCEVAENDNCRQWLQNN